MTRHRLSVRWRDDRGQMAGIEALPFGVLVFVLGSLLLANVWAVVDAKLATTAAAREGARVYVESADAPEAIEAGTDAARRSITGHGRDADRARITFTHDDDRPFARCTRVRTSVSYRVPALDLPLVGGLGSAITVESTHSEVVDPFRDGLGPAGGCG